MSTRMKSGERRAVIVASAIRLFSEKGFRGTTTRQLASAVGVTEPILYQHFRTKSDLYTAIIETKAKEGGQRAAQVLQYLEGKDDRGFLTSLAELVLEHYQEDPGFIRLLLFSALERHELAAVFFENQVVQFYNMVAGYIKRRIKDGAFREVNTNVAARAFIGMISHHGLVEVLFGNQALKVQRKKLVDEVVTTFLHGIYRNGEGRL